jgi:hypothetical protein
LSENLRQENSVKLGAVYIDGFNLYHPIHDSGQNHLKWCNLWKLSEILCQSEGVKLEKVVFCTAVPKHYPDSLARHQNFNAAQIANGVLVLKGHHVPDDGGYSEKQSDINVALSLIIDGLEGVYHTAFLISADSDQVATAKFFKQLLTPKGKVMVAAIPFGQTFPSGFEGLGVKRFDITIDHIDQCLLPEEVQGKAGIIRRPAEYAPPAGYVYFDARPKEKPKKTPKKSAWSKGVKG